MTMVSAVSRKLDQLDLFITGSDGHVYTTWWSPGQDWPGLQWRDIGGTFPPGAPVAVVSRNPDQLDLFICGQDGRVYTSWWTPGVDWSGLGQWRNIGGVFPPGQVAQFPPGAPIAAVSRNPNQIDLFVCGFGGHVYTSWWSAGADWSGLGDKWRDIGGVFSSGAPVAAVSRDLNHLDLFICGQDGHVYTSWWSAGADWSGLGNHWRDIGGVFPKGVIRVAAVSRDLNHLDLFICGQDGHVYTSWWSAGADWSGLGDKWRDIGGVFPSGAPVTVVSRNPNQLDLFICGDDSRVYTSWWSAGADWSGLGNHWRNLGGAFPGPRPAFLPGTLVTAVSRNPNHLDLFVPAMGDNAIVYTSGWTAGSDWSGLNDHWRLLGGAFPTSLDFDFNPIVFDGGVPVGWLGSPDDS
jgi:hypothetical protein